MPSLEEYFDRVPSTMTVAPWLGGLLVARINVLTPLVRGDRYARIAYSLMADCGKGVDKMSGAPFDPPIYAQKVAAYPMVYRNECVRAFTYAHGQDFGNEAREWLRAHPQEPVPMPTYQQAIDH